MREFMLKYFYMQRHRVRLTQAQRIVQIHAAGHVINRVHFFLALFSHSLSN